VESWKDWAKSIAASDSGAIYMGVGQAREIADALRAAGISRSMPVAIVENASLAQSRTIFTTLAELANVAGESLTGPAVMLIGAQFAASASADVDASMPHFASVAGGAE